MSRLARSESDRILGGVCGGLGAYLGVDPVIVRIAFVLLAMFNGMGLLAYLIIWVLVPTESTAAETHEHIVRENVQEIGQRARQLGADARGDWGRQWRAGQGSSKRMLLLGGGLVLIGLLMLLDNFGLLWWFSLGTLWPLIPIAIGGVLLLNNLKDAK